MKTWHVLLGLGVLGGAAFAVYALAGRDVRHGVFYDGTCDSVTLVDPVAFGAYVEAKVRPWVGAGRTDFDQMLIEVYRDLLPECEWPPPAGSARHERWTLGFPRAVEILEAMFGAEGAAGQDPPKAGFDPASPKPARVPIPPKLQPTASKVAQIGRILS